MREVPAAMLDFARQAAERRGVPARAILEEMGLSHVDPTCKGERVDWDQYTLFAERCVQVLGPGGEDVLATAFIDENRHVQLLGRLPLPPRELYRLFTLGSRPYLPHMDLAARDLPDGRIELIWQIREPSRYRGSLVMFRALAEEIRHLATVLGYPPAKVEADVGPHHGRYRVHLPEPRGRLTRLVDAGTRRIEGAARELVSMLGSAVRTGIPWHSAEVLQRRYGLTEAETRVAIAIAEGRAPAQVAERLAVSEATVRSHLKQAFAKTSTHRQTDLVRLVLGISG